MNDCLIENFDCAVPYSKTENCVIVKGEDWVKATESALITKKEQVTNIQEVQGVGYTEVFADHGLKAGDKVVLTKAASNIAYLKPYKLPDHDKKYSNVHLMQVIGKLEDDNVNLLYSKVELIQPNMQGLPAKAMYTGMEMQGLYFVTDVGMHGFTEAWEPSEVNSVQAGKYAIVDGTLMTKIDTKKGAVYFTEREFIVAQCDEENFSFDIKDWDVMEDKLVLEPYIDEKNGLLYNPLYDLEENDISEVYNPDKFKVIKVGKNFESKFSEGDIVHVGRDYLNFLNVFGKELFFTRTDEYIKGKYM